MWPAVRLGRAAAEQQSFQKRGLHFPTTYPPSLPATPPVTKPGATPMPRPPADPARPAVCSLIFAPVCGADGQTYPSNCTRDAAGVAFGSEGVCPGTDPASVARPGIEPGPPPPTGQVPTSPLPGATTPPGWLASSPAGQPLAETPTPRLPPGAATPCPRIFMPVCASSADGTIVQTFNNDCLARAGMPGAAVRPGACGENNTAGDEVPAAGAGLPPLRAATREPAVEDVP